MNSRRPAKVRMSAPDRIVPVDPDAAAYFHRSASQVRRWIAEGAPVERKGRGARGAGALVNLSKVEQWYATRYNLPSLSTWPTKELFEQIPLWFFDALKRDSSGEGMPIHHMVGISETQAAGFLVLLHRYLFLRQFERAPRESDIPEPIARLFTIARMDARGGSVRKL